MKQTHFFRFLAVLALILPLQLAAKTDKPNILVMWGDDVGVWNTSAYNRGGMGYKTPNIDSIANEGALFTDMYAQQSCTADRAAFILGEQPFRTGLLTIGMPGSDQGIPDWAPTIADLLKEQGYATGQFGKNHLGDQDKHLPTSSSQIRGGREPVMAPTDHDGVVRLTHCVVCDSDTGPFFDRAYLSDGR